MGFAGRCRQTAIRATPARERPGSTPEQPHSRRRATEETVPRSAAFLPPDVEDDEPCRTNAKRLLDRNDRPEHRVSPFRGIALGGRDRIQAAKSSPSVHASCQAEPAPRRTAAPTSLFAVGERVSNPAHTPSWPLVLLLTAYSDTLDRSSTAVPGQISIHGRAGTSLRDPLGTATRSSTAEAPPERRRQSYE